MPEKNWSRNSPEYKAFAIATYPASLLPETLRLWTAAKRATSWRRICFMIERATDWPVTAWIYFAVAIPAMLVAGWLHRRLAPLMR